MCELWGIGTTFTAVFRSAIRVLSSPERESHLCLAKHTCTCSHCVGHIHVHRLQCVHVLCVHVDEYVCMTNPAVSRSVVLSVRSLVHRSFSGDECCSVLTCPL